MSNLKQNVMLRVRTIHLMRPFVNELSYGAALMVAALYLVGQQVWVGQVFANMPSVFNLQALASFFVAAFLNTETLVQVLLFVTLVALLVMVRGFVALLVAATPQRA